MNAMNSRLNALRWNDRFVGLLRGKLRAFGSVWRLTSLRDALRFAWHRWTGNEVWVTLRRPRHRVLLRPDNSDLAVLLQTFLEDGCNAQPWVRAPRVIVDAGANIGATTLLFSSQFPDATVVAIEPDPENFRLLEENTRSLAGVVRLRAALWPHEALLSLRQSAGQSWACCAEESNAGTCSSVTLRQLFERHGEIDLLKLDIEGASGLCWRVRHWTGWYGSPW
jgi:FkbM family methyltransferase